ncbi:MAG: hypothetical protein KC442_10885 [Thermomicrobiales bacterium]|nr:hypothetical protein [Thermomicrobiales bacterium]
MDETRFDAWTRRRFGLAAGGAAASVLGLLGAIGLSDPDAEARKKHNKNKNRKNNKRKRKPKCRKLGDACDNNRRNQQCCNDNQLCAQVSEFGSGDYCCKQNGYGCQSSSDCCGKNRCRNGLCQIP